MADFAILDGRGVLALAGEDRSSFLQGLTSNDVRLVAPAQAVFSALLTAQGKYLHDFFVVDQDDAWLIECEGARRGDLLRRLGAYRLRAKVALSDVTDRWTVAVAYGDGAEAAFGLRAIGGAAVRFARGIAFVDPRSAAMGVRLVVPRAEARAALISAGLTEQSPDAYDRHRLAQGMPDGSRDLLVEKSTLIEARFDELNAISWTKGCYLGQELTARTRYRGLVKRRLVPVRVEGPLPAPGTPIFRDGREVGEMRSGRDDLGIALLRLEAFVQIKDEESGPPLAAAGATLVPRLIDRNAGDGNGPDDVQIDAPHTDVPQGDHRRDDAP